MKNASANSLDNVASKLIPSEDYSPNKYSIKLPFRPSIPEYVNNWLVFNDDYDIVIFLTLEGSYDDQIIYENKHGLELKKNADENPIPKSIVKLEDICHLKDRFKKVTNAKAQSWTLIFELVNLGTNGKPQNISLSISLSSNERSSSIRLLNKYKGIFAWDYYDLNTYDTFFIQHTIPMISNNKPVQHKLWKIHPNLESQIK